MASARGMTSCREGSSSLRAQRSNPYLLRDSLDCFAALAMTLIGSGPLEQYGHEDHVFVHAVDLNRVALQTFRRKTELPVQRDRVGVVFPDRQLDTVKSECFCRGERAPDQVTADSLAAKRRKLSHAEHTGMGMDWQDFVQEVPPAAKLDRSIG